ncbi:adhesion G protein-coupled receptor F5 isoform X1 [Mauremys reevesii]|uniref:adhesion G protein-coupled receptor F5 isoform X1 n=1 Tax=Mauremys reevesii TaxID=260615 RepID=UPI00193F61CB|nr:adhesion G protein-coupled receptor F5 isoform X1 [Mauremys reevesii]
MGKQRTETETEAHTWPGSALPIARERLLRGAWHSLSFRFCNKILGEMPSLGITVFCFLLLIVTTSTHASMEVNFDPFVSLSPDGENGTKENVPTKLHRQKRQVATFGLSPMEYKINIEISYTDPSLLEAIKDYFKNLSFPVILNTLNAAMNISSLNVTTVCSLTSNNETRCSCESGYRWPAAVCSANTICPSTIPTQEEICDCITQVPSQGSSCQLQPEGQTNFSVSPEDIFQGDTVKMKCELRLDAGKVTWYHSGHVILNSRHSIRTIFIKETTTSVLEITSVTQDDTGPYTCVFIDSSVNSTLEFKATRNITVAPINIVQSGDTEVICDGTKVSLSCCIDGNIQSFTTTWRPNTGTISFTPNCTKYTLQANHSQCPSPSDSEIMYTCELSTGKGAIRSKTINVTYLRIANLKISSITKAQVSEGHSFNLTCTNDVSNCNNVIWKIQSQMIDSRLYSCKNSTSEARSILTVNSATQAWNGTYTCTLFQKSLSSSASTTVEIVPLPLKQNIVLDPIQGFIQCNVPQVLKCCINGTENYDVTFTVQQTKFKGVENIQGNQVCYTYNYTESCNSKSDVVAYCTFVNRIQDKVTSSPMKLSIILENKVTCSGSIGVGQQGARITKPCPASQGVNGMSITVRGTVIYVCNNSNWEVARNSCISDQINALLSNAESLVYGPQAEEQLPTYLETLHNTTLKEQQEINTSPANLVAVITILDLVSKIPTEAKPHTMENFLSTVNIIVDNSTIPAWKVLNNQQAENSSRLLNSVEKFSQSLRPANNTIPLITNTNLQLQGIVITENSTSDYNKSFTFSNSANLSGNVLINKNIIKKLPRNSTVISVAFSTLRYILPKPNETDRDVNGLVMMTTMNSTLFPEFQISLTFAKSNSSLKEPQCVFWNTSHSAAEGGWDDTGCAPKDEGDNVICTCNHLTSFSILMSFDQGSSPPGAVLQSLDYITYIGLSISIVSLIICIIIESLVWKYVTKNRTSYMRHVCILNIAVSLLLADSWFIVTAFVQDKKELVNGNVCIAATFFIHLFYLSLFFWMLALGLMIFYRLVFILHDTSKTIQKAVAFSLGYGCPLIISVITIAVTQPHNTYMRENACWLNWEKSKALLAFIIPALIIVAVNSIIAVVILVKILRPAIGEKPNKQERSSLIQAIKNVATLTPLFGLTWGFGVATLSNDSPIVFHILFTLLNAFQGLFILVFGTLRDKKVVEALQNKYSLGRWSTQQTKSTSLGDSGPVFSMSSPFSEALNNLFGKAGKYKISSTEATGSFSEHTSNTYSELH